MVQNEVGTIVNWINVILNEDRDQVWGCDALSTAVCDKMSYKNAMRVKVIITALVNAQAIYGQISKNGYVSSIRWKKETDYSGKSAGSAYSAGNSTEDKTAWFNGEIDKYKKAVEVALKREKDAVAREEAALKAAQEAQGRERIIEIVLKDNKGKVAKKTPGLFHTQFEKMLKLAQARMNIFIYGPTGCGKSHVCEQLATSLNLKFGFVSCTSGMSEGQITGKLLPVGKQGTFEYVISEFINLYETGGIFLFDEIDAADPNILLVVNTALANCKIGLPNRPEKPYAIRHKDFVCIAAANTVGTGADRIYSGRNKLDASTLDRFAIGKIYMDYDERVETALCPDQTLYSKLITIRKGINAHRLERAMSTRFMRDAYVMQNEWGFSFDDIQAAFFSGWREDEINKVKSFQYA